MHRGHTETGRKEFLKKAHFFALHSHSARAATQPGYRMSSGCLMGKWCSPLHCRYLKQYVKLKAYWTGFLHEPTFIRNLHCQIFIFFSFNCLNQSSKAKTLQFESQSAKKTCRGFHHFRWRWKLDSNLEVGLKKLDYHTKRALNKQNKQSILKETRHSPQGTLLFLTH